MAVEAKPVPVNENAAAPYLAPIVVASLLKKHDDARALALNALNDAGKFYRDSSSQSDQLGAMNLFISAMWEVFRWDATPDAEHLMMQIFLAFEDSRLGRSQLDLNQWLFRAVLVVGKDLIVEADREQGSRISNQSVYDQLKALLRRNGVCMPNVKGGGEKLENIIINFTAPSRFGKADPKRDAAHQFYAELKEQIRARCKELGYSAHDTVRFFEREVLAKHPVVPRKPKQKGGMTK